MLKSELEALCAEQKARIEELEAQVAEGAEDLVSGYLVFGTEHVDALGGWDDYLQCFAEEDVARTRAEELVMEGWAWAQVVELPTGRMKECYRNLSDEVCWRD